MPRLLAIDTGPVPKLLAAGLLALAIQLLAFAFDAAAAAPSCRSGFVLRLATATDNVCVVPASQARVASENARAPLLWAPGAYGARTCAPGFVWRASSADDLVCVLPAIRSLAAQENADAAQNAGP